MSLLSLLPVIKEVTLDSAAASVSIDVPSNYEILFLETDYVKGDNAAAWVSVDLTFNGDTGNNYDHSEEKFGTASSTSNGQAKIKLGNIADVAAGNDWVVNGSAVIFNRASQEKVVIGTSAGIETDAHDFDYAIHYEGKWRNTSDPITSIGIAPSGGNFAANSKFILRGINTTACPPASPSNPDIIQFIGSHECAGAEASVTLPSIPAGMGIVYLFWHWVDGDNAGAQGLNLTFNGDEGASSNNYDHSRKAYGSASATTNAADLMLIGYTGAVGNTGYVDNGFATIFNRDSYEKVLIATEGMVHTENGSGTQHDIAGNHVEAKWRNTTDEINSVKISASVGNFIAGSKFYLFGVRV